QVTDQKRVQDLDPDFEPKVFSTLPEELDRKFEAGTNTSETSMVKATQQTIEIEPEDD
ncbi:MAG: hypothetical protein GTO40_07295, partial [Deltaproteobacteria bacterium]|nr:hypothetical protein [Deltaproteobacteria bacterium]